MGNIQTIPLTFHWPFNVYDDYYSHLYHFLLLSIQVHVWSKVGKETVTEAVLTLDSHECDTPNQLELRVTPTCEPISGLVSV
jgi:hypothetical protein